MIPSLRDSYFFVLESYTTLGGGNVALPDQWRLVGPMIGMSGIFTFGWTGSVLVTIMNELGKLDRTQATKDQRDSARAARARSGSASGQRQSSPCARRRPTGRPPRSARRGRGAPSRSPPAPGRRARGRPRARRGAAALAITSRMCTKP